MSAAVELREVYEPPLPRYTVAVCEGCPLRRDRVRLAVGLGAILEPYGLTPAERGVLVLLARGLPNAGIADELVVTEQTVKFHLTSVYRKLRVSSRVAAALIAWEAGVR